MHSKIRLICKYILQHIVVFSPLCECVRSLSFSLSPSLPPSNPPTLPSLSHPSPYHLSNLCIFWIWVSRSKMTLVILCVWIGRLERKDQIIQMAGLDGEGSFYVPARSHLCRWRKASGKPEHVYYNSKRNGIWRRTNTMEYFEVRGIEWNCLFPIR